MILINKLNSYLVGKLAWNPVNYNNLYNIKNDARWRFAAKLKDKLINLKDE